MIRRTIRVLVAIALAPATGVTASAQAPPPELTAMAARARLDRPIAAWCRGVFRAGEGAGFAVAVSSAAGGGRYLVLGVDSSLMELAPYADAPDVSCYSRAEAESLSAAIAGSETVAGKITPRFDTAVVCAFLESTGAACWQYSPTERAFVRVGGWIT